MRSVILCSAFLVACGGSVTVEQSDDGSGGSGAGGGPGVPDGGSGGDGGQLQPDYEPLYCPQTTEGNLTTENYDTSCLPCTIALKDTGECPADESGDLNNFVGNLALCFGDPDCCLDWEDEPLYEDAIDLIQCMACDACFDECAGEPLFHGYCD